MKEETIPVNPAILKWARKSLNLPIETVAQKLKKKPDIIADWEEGRSQPTYSQLEKLAYTIYKRPVALFFFPDAPEEPTPQRDFRSVPKSLGDRLPTEIIKQYRRAKYFQYCLEELYEGKKPVPKNLADKYSLVNNGEIPNLTKQIRRELDISIEQQTSWRSPEMAFKKWRRALELNGIFIFKSPFHEDNYSGFCIHHDYYPLIYVNNSMPPSRQVFTLFHELGHLLMGSGGVDFRETYIPQTFPSDFKQKEILCNQFAGEFLVPSDAFRAINEENTEESIDKLSKHFSVSREVILRKRLDLRLITQDQYKNLTEKWAAAKSSRTKSKGGNFHQNQIAYLGDHYLELAFQKFYQHKISVETLAEYLGITPSGIPGVEAKFLSRSDKTL